MWATARPCLILRKSPYWPIRNYIKSSAKETKNKLCKMKRNQNTSRHDRYREWIFQKSTLIQLSNVFFIFLRMNIISDREIRNLQRDREQKEVSFPNLSYRLLYEKPECKKPLSPPLEKILAPNWYFVCEWLEKKKYEGYLDKMEGKRWHGVDVGGLIAIWDTGE